MKKLTTAEMGAVLITVIGGLNWLLVGLFKFNLVDKIFGEGSMLARVIYVIVGVAAVYTFSFGPKLRKEGGE